MKIALPLTLLTILWPASGQECQFDTSGHLKNTFAVDKKDCPCFHSESDPRDCDLDRPNNPLGPLVECRNLPKEFIVCNPPVDHGGNESDREILGHGCVRFGGQRWEEVEKTKVCCRALDCIECKGNRTFLRGGYPCIRYSNQYFLTTLLYSVLLGFLGLDRFCLGQTGTAVGKLLSLGGFGIWWIVDIVLLVSGNLTPEDGSNWIPYV